MATVGQQLTAPESGWKRYDDRNPVIKYTGTWNVVTGDARFYNGTVTWINNPTNTSIRFKFKGTKIRVIGTRYQDRSSNIQIKIDGVAETYSEYKAVSSTEGQILVYEKIGLSDATHDVEITTLSGSYSLDAIDIDDTGRLLHPDEVTDPKDLDIGKRIRCHYQGGSNVVGTLSNLGQETSDFIPPASSATPNGDFYWIAVDKDHLGRWKLIADRNIQHSISWDTLNSEGIASGSGLPIIPYKRAIPFLKSATQDSISISESSVYTNAYGWYVFDGQISTCWHANGSAPQWIKVDCGVGNTKKIVAYAITPRNDDPSYPYYPKDFKLEGSDDGVTWNVVDSRTGVTWSSITDRKFFICSSPNDYRYYRLTVTSVTSGSYVALGELELYELDTAMDKKYKFTTRLLTGGISFSDNTDSEWTKYIVNSTLNNTITTGDNNVWNWSGIDSWTSTVVNGTPANRVKRGNSSSSSHTNTASSGYSAIIGFRPVLLIEILPSNKSFIYINGEYKTWDDSNKQWVTASTFLPSKDTFDNQGIDNISTLNRKQTTLQQAMNNNGTLGSGKVFVTTVDLNKYFDLVGLNVK
jgi:hypothetical protein